MTSKDPGGDSPEAPQLVTAEEAADRLGVKTGTVYTYVSRGMLSPVRKPGDRSSWFRVPELEALRNRAPRQSRGRRDEAPSTAITLISNGRYYYRGRDPVELLEHCSFEQVAELLWTGEPSRQREWSTEPHAGSTFSRIEALTGADALPLDRLRLAVVAMAGDDHLRFSTSVPTVVVTARRLITDLVRALPLVGKPPKAAGIVPQLWSRLTSLEPSAEHLFALNGALILMADHGLAPSTVAARQAASFRADPHSVIEVGLSVVAGGWHGGRALSAEKMLADLETEGDVAAVIGRMMRAGGIPCLGHPRYPAGDPRTPVMLQLVAKAEPGHPVLLSIGELQVLIADRALPLPTSELGLAAMSRAFGFVEGASEALFGIARSAGWIAHAIEMYDRPSRPAPVFDYTGPRPGTKRAFSD